MTVLFMHIPKTAGTSVRFAIESVIPPAERIYLYEPSHMPIALTVDQLAALSDERKRGIRLVMGHFQYGVHRVLPQETRYVTVLREPVDRLVSMYTFYQRDFPALVGDQTLEEWATSGTSIQTDNEMVRRIAGCLEAPYGSLTPATLCEAIEHIDREFAVVVLTEELNVNYDALGNALGAPLPPPGNRNAAPERIAIETRLRDQLADLNRFDVALYEYVRARRLLRYAGR